MAGWAKALITRPFQVSSGRNSSAGVTLAFAPIVARSLSSNVRTEMVSPSISNSFADLIAGLGLDCNPIAEFREFREARDANLARSQLGHAAQIVSRGSSAAASS